VMIIFYLGLMTLGLVFTWNQWAYTVAILAIISIVLYFILYRVLYRDIRKKEPSRIDIGKDLLEELFFAKNSYNEGKKVMSYEEISFKFEIKSIYQSVKVMKGNKVIFGNIFINFEEDEMPPEELDSNTILEIEYGGEKKFEKDGPKVSLMKIIESTKTQDIFFVKKNDLMDLELIFNILRETIKRIEV